MKPLVLLGFTIPETLKYMLSLSHRLHGAEKPLFFGFFAEILWDGYDNFSQSSELSGF